jgi:hypothetical protein
MTELTPGAAVDSRKEPNSKARPFGRKGSKLRSYSRNALAVALLSGVGMVDASTVATAGTSGDQHFSGMIVASGRSGGRDVLSSVIIGRGVVRGVGRIVEIDSLPTDPDNVSRDDLVFREGTLHLSVENVDFNFSLNPRTCVVSASIQQTGEVEGGTGRYADAAGSFTGSVTARGVLRRTSDGTCSQDQAPLIEVDTLSADGSLTL